MEHGGSSAWQMHVFVLDVPADAPNPFVDVGPIGRVTILLDEPKLEAAGRELSTTRTVRVTHPIDGYNYNHCTRDKPIAGAPAPTGGATPPNDFVRQAARHAR